MDDDERRALGLFRFGVLGPLVSARLEHGDRTAYFTEAAARHHLMPPDGRIVRLSARTIESWFYLYKHGGFDALVPDVRADKGTSRVLGADLADLVLRAKREKPRRSLRRIIRMLERAGVVTKGQLSRATVHRLLAAEGISARPVRGPSAERRSFIAEHAGDLCVGDAMHPRAPVIGRDGKLHKVILFSQIDNATRFILHSYLAVVPGESAAAQEYGLKQVILKYGPPRAYYVDRGPAYISQSLRDICADLGIHLVHAGAGDAEAKGVIERWHRTWREEVEDELPDAPLTVDDLAAKHWAWLGAEYHATTCSTRPPRSAHSRPARISTRSSSTATRARCARTAPSAGAVATSKSAQNSRATSSSGSIRPTTPRSRASSPTASSFATPSPSIAWPTCIASADVTSARPSPSSSPRVSIRSPSSRTSTTGARASSPLRPATTT